MGTALQQAPVLEREIMCSPSYLIIKKENVMCAVTGRPTSVDGHVIFVLGAMLASMKLLGPNLGKGNNTRQKTMHGRRIGQNMYTYTLLYLLLVKVFVKSNLYMDCK